MHEIKPMEMNPHIASYKVTSKYEFKSPSMSVPKQRNLREGSRYHDVRETRSINSSYNTQNNSMHHISMGNALRVYDKRTISQNYSNNPKYSTLEPDTPTVRENRFELPDLSRRSERKKRKLPMSSAERKLPE